MAVTINPQQYYSTTGANFLYWAPLNSAAFATAISANTYSGFSCLGACVRTPEVFTNNAFEPVMNAIGGVSIPTNQSYQGSNATVVCPMNWVSESSLRALKALPYYNGTGTSQFAAQDAGSWAWADFGSLSQQDGAAFMLVQVYAGAANGGPPGLPNGRRFFCCTWPEGRETDMTTVPKIDTLIFQANQYRGAFSLNGTFVDARVAMYDFSVPAFGPGGFVLPGP